MKTSQSKSATNRVDVRSRNEKFSKRLTSHMTQEVVSSDNPFLAKSMRTYGYDCLDLMNGCSFTDGVYLLFHGELPNSRQSELMQKLSMLLLNLGPRHVASRAAINAVIGKTANTHVVPVAAMALCGDYNGALEVEQSMRFLLSSAQQTPEEHARRCIENIGSDEKDELILAPGFGCDYGGQSPLLIEQKDLLLKFSPTKGYLHWAERFVRSVSSQHIGGWRLAGVVAAVLLDLHFKPRNGAAVFQLFSLPGAVAQGLEFAGRPLTDVPFLDDDHYVIQNEA